MNSLYRTMLFVPGNNPKKIISAEVYGADCIIYDLEDSVSVFGEGRFSAATPVMFNRGATASPAEKIVLFMIWFECISAK